MPDVAKFCAKCGTPLSQHDIESAQNSKTPEEAQKWNWGAALLTWIWALGNKTYGWAFLGFLINVTGIGWILNFFLFGLNGSEWSWKNKKWDNIEHFQKVQKIWRNWGIALFIVLILLGILAAVFEEDSNTGSTGETISNSDVQVEDTVAQADYNEGYKAGYVDGRGANGTLGDNYAEPATEERKEAYFNGYTEGFLKGCREGGFDCSEVEAAIKKQQTTNQIMLIPQAEN